MKLPAPAANGELLAVPSFGQAPALVAANRDSLNTSNVVLDGIPLRELRAMARQELSLSNLPLIVTGHQPELSHPGVWVKNFAACGLARRIGGTSLNLIVDTDLVKLNAIRLPEWDAGDPSTARLVSLRFDEDAREMAYEGHAISNPELFASFGQRLRAATMSWPFEPLGITSIDSTRLCRAWTQLRREREEAWGCRNVELPVSRLARLQSFQHFVRHIVAERDRFRKCYNVSLAEYRRQNRVRSRNHPAPDLAADELPFWSMTPAGRVRATSIDDLEQIRPRALTLTLFARLILADYFIHGLGGGLYDRVTDAIMKSFFDIEPPAFQILTATLHLPLPLPMANNLHHYQWYGHHTFWNPQQILLDRDTDGSMERHRQIIGMLVGTRIQRRQRYREFRALSARLRPRVADRQRGNDDIVHRLQREQAARVILTRRDFAWVLYPENVLKPFLQKFLDP